jgi:hypothetical protein
MKSFISIVLLTPFILGNSAGGLGGLVFLAGGAIIGLGVIIGIIWGLIKWLT